MSEYSFLQPPPLSINTPPSSSSTTETDVYAQRLEVEKIHLLYTQSAAAALITLGIGVTILVLLLWSVVAHARLLAWASFMAVIAATRWALVCRYRSRKRPAEELGYWRLLLFLSVAITGGGWGLAGFFLFPKDSLPHQVFLVIFLGGVSIVSIANLAAIRSLFFLFFSSLMAPTALRLLLNGEMVSVTVGLLCVSFSGYLVPIVNYIHVALVESLRLRFANLDLVESLSAAKEQADHARMQLAASHAALSKSEERFRLLVEQAADVVTILNTDGTIRYISPSVESWLGYSPEALIGQPLTSLLHPSDQEHFRTNLNAVVLEGEKKQAFEAQWRHETEVWRTVDSVMRNFLDDETVKGITLSSRDITERKDVERLKDDLVSTVSHELRTPLTSLLGFTELMLTREFPVDQQRQFLTIMHDETRRLANLINDFLDLQRIESGQQPYTFADVDVRSLLHDTATLFASTNGKHVFDLKISESLPRARLDVGRIRQVLANLCSNAIKFSPNGGKITLSAVAQEGAVEISVSDEGVGIPSDMIPQLFHKFFRVDSTETRKIGGTGLGLALVKQIVETHGGQVRVTSQAGKGSTFSFSLPLGT